jgi:FkbM family methyltransferase
VNFEHFVSYSQNFEDVILWRALKGVKNGFYIDVGGWDPIEDSVTQGFYVKGWHGINIEPVPQHAAKFEAARPRDLNLMIAVSDQEGEAQLHAIGDTGLSTLSEIEAKRHAATGRELQVEHVKTTTLARICQEHVTGPVHFLKVDVEGAELSVLRGMDFKACRPWIVLVESTIPGTPEESFADWEPILLNNDYVFVYFDGLNRYYVPVEREQAMRPSFRCPPNPFDRYSLFREDTLRQKVWELDMKIQALAQTSEHVSGLESVREQLLVDLEKSKGRVNELKSDLDKLKAEVRSSEEECRRLRGLIRHHKANPLRALILWWNRKKSGMP